MIPSLSIRIANYILSIEPITMITIIKAALYIFTIITTLKVIEKEYKK